MGYTLAGMYKTHDVTSSARVRWILSVVSLVAYVFTKVSVTVYAGAIVFQVLLPDLQLALFGRIWGPFWIGAFATVFLILGFYMRSAAWSGIAMVPTLLPAVVTLGAMGMLGLSLDVGRSMIAAVLTNLEATAMTLVLPDWTSDVLSLRQAWRIRNSRPPPRQ